jgi:hypothetical protein
VDFIFMLTRNDRTIEDAFDVVELIRPAGLRHIGFKDVGATPEMLARLVEKIHAIGARAYVEMVATDPLDCLEAAKLARDIGVDRLLGGTQAKEVLAILKGSRTEYLPFPGKPVGHPTKLGGLPADVEADCRAFTEEGCAGCDILAYRATDANPLDLVRAARRGLGAGKQVVVAGAVKSLAQIRAIKQAGADAFTIGTAIFDGSYAPTKGSILSQLKDVLVDCARA